MEYYQKLSIEKKLKKIENYIMMNNNTINM